MQSWFVEHLESEWPVMRTSISTHALMTADEVFLTNALFGIRWVRQIGDRQYAPMISHKLYHQYIRTIFS
jgi:branched-chain amino acid aminotransferase